ncbi:DUF3592 domain-containing protein [Lentzea albidocapillata]|uniref:DUF3592 domain-containing protein n=1 Tax=Lentzea albidocapillata TaxID=40571 RepID=A0A1W2AXT5_9PSEU|nr:DUF3592 domain-containing protein [Lentzea albidocapillata]SMC65535.1 hypothetical protein SAMN05660733_00792 [Lentzea albidocapillata]
MTKTPRGVRVRRAVCRVLFVVGGVITLVCVLLPIACWRDDLAIERSMGQAVAQVDSVSFNRTVVRYATPDGRVIIPSQGVLYPAGLSVGDNVRVEYDQTNPELARVAGRTAVLSLLPVGTFLVSIWIVIAAVVTVLRRFGTRV